MVAYGKLSLATRENGQFTVCLPLGHTCLGFDVPLVDRLSSRRFFNDYISIFKTLFNVTEIEFKLVSDVGT